MLHCCKESFFQPTGQTSKIWPLFSGGLSKSSCCIVAKTPSFNLLSEAVFEFACCVVAWQFQLFLGRLQKLNMASFFRGACQKVHVALLRSILLSAYILKQCMNLPVALLRGNLSCFWEDFKN